VHLIRFAAAAVSIDCFYAFIATSLDRQRGTHLSNADSLIHACAQYRDRL